MSNPGAMTIEELQRAGFCGDEAAIMELGRRVLDLDFCIGDNTSYCEHEQELAVLEHELAFEMPPDCPHCGKFITDQ